MDKIKVLQINKLYHPVTGGVERVVQQIAEGLRDRTDMEVLVCQKKGRGAIDQVNGVPVHLAGSLGMAFSTPLSLNFFGRFRRLRKDRDILHIHMPFPLADVALWLFGFKGKVAVWWHADILKQKRLLLLYKPFMRNLLGRADVIMTATQGHIDHSEFLPPYRDKCVVIPFGVDPGLLEKSAGCANRERPVDKPFSFLFVGRLVYYKGCDVLLEAFAGVPDAELVLVGSGPLEDDLKARARKLGIENRVRFRAEISDDALAGAFSDCDVFVLPSIAKTEAFALVQIEAMAYSKPVINTDLPSGVPYVSLDGLTGLTVSPGDAAALASAMNRLKDDSALRERFGKAAYARAREEYAMDRMLHRVYKEYQQLMEE